MSYYFIPTRYKKSGGKKFYGFYMVKSIYFFVFKDRTMTHTNH